jgi:hypothetical protein
VFIFSKLTYFSTFERASEEINAHCQEDAGLDSTYRRNAKLARFKAYAYGIAPYPWGTNVKKCIAVFLTAEVEVTNSCLSILEYLCQNGHRSSAFEDVYPNFIDLDLDQRDKCVEVLNYIMKHDLITVSFETPETGNTVTPIKLNRAEVSLPGRVEPVGRIWGKSSEY